MGIGLAVGRWGATGWWEFEILYGLQKLHNPWLDQVMVFITGLADHGVLWILLGLLFLCFSRTRRMGACLLLSVVLGFVTGNLVLKHVFARSRPCWIQRDVRLLVPVPRDYSFPSGHTMVSFEGAYSIWRNYRLWGALAIGLALLIACSRMYLFVHFPTDILAGAVLGIANGLGGQWLAGKLEGWLGHRKRACRKQ